LEVENRFEVFNKYKNMTSHHEFPSWCPKVLPLEDFEHLICFMATSKKFGVVSQLWTRSGNCSCNQLEQ